MICLNFNPRCGMTTYGVRCDVGCDFGARDAETVYAVVSHDAEGAITVHGAFREEEDARRLCAVLLGRSDIEVMETELK